MEMGAGGGAAREVPGDQRKRGHLLAGPGPLAEHPAVREAPRGPRRRGHRACSGPYGGFSVYPFVFVTLCSGRAFPARALPRFSMKAIQVKETGGPEKLELVDIPVPQPGPRQALVKIAVSGVNFIDVYFRTGLYKADLPVTLGQEGAGVVEEVGREVTEVRRGDRVAYAMARGSYAEYALVPSWQLVKVPDNIGLNSAAAAMLQGMTAHYLTHSTYPLKAGDTCLVHAAAGGAGRLIVQMAKIRGAHVLGTTSTEAKGELARQAGIDEVIYYTRQDFEAEVRRLTDGRGVDVVYDSVGAPTYMQGLNCLRPRGMMVLDRKSGG